MIQEMRPGAGLFIPAPGLTCSIVKLRIVRYAAISAI